MPGCELEYNKVLNIHSNNYIINPLKDEQNEQEDKKQFVDNPSWLLRLFESPHFDMHLAISYLHGSKEPGVHSYIAFNEVADILQPYLIYRCKTDIDFALKALCLLEAFYSSVSPNTLSKENNGLKLKDIIFADDLKNHDTMNEKVKSSLSVYSMHCQQFKIKGLHHKHQNQHHYRSMSDATNVIKLDILNQSTMMMPSYLNLPPINANISTAVALQSHMFTNNNNNSKKNMAAPLWNLAAATKRANNLFPLKTFGNLNSGKAFDNGCQCHHHHMITNNTNANTFQQGPPPENRYRSMDVIKTASSNSSLSIDSNNNNYYHLYNNNNTTYNIGPGLGVKNLIKFSETTTSKTDDITKSTKNPVCSSSSTRVSLCKCEAPKVLPEYEFLKSLHGIGTKLQSFPSRELRTSKLISEITLLNSNLPSRVWLPIYSHKLPHHILRIHPTSAVVLNSKDKVPFIVYIEVNECEDLSTSLVPSKLTEPGPFHLEPCLHCVFNNNANTKPYSQNARNKNGNNTTSNVISYNKERDNPYRFLQSSADQLFNQENQSIIGNQCFTQSSINLNIDIDNNSQSCDDNHNMNENNSCADTISTSSFAMNTPQYDEGLFNNNNTNTNNNNKNLYDEISQLSVDSYLSAESSTTKFFYNNRAPPPASSKIYLNGNKQQPEISKQLLPRAAKCHLQSSTSSLQHDPEDPSASILTEPWDQKVHRIKEHSPYGHLPKWNLLPVIVKCGDDLRHEQIAQQMLALLQKIWKMEHVPLWLYPYEIFVFNNTSGLIEPITNAVSLHHIKKNFDATLSYRVSCAGSLAQVKHLNNEDRFSNKIHNHHVILPPSTALPNERENFVENDGKNDEFSAVISSSSSEELTTTTNTQISSSAATGAGLSGLTSMIKRINIFASSDPSLGVSGTGGEKSPPLCQAQRDTTGDQTYFPSEQPPFKKNKTKDCSLLSYFLHEFGSPTTERFLNAQKNFVQSCAAYCIVCYLLLLKDRHNGNILLDTEGHIIHIDFAFILSNSPRNLGFESSPFKLTQEFVDVMGGIGSDMFEYFKILMLKGLIAARKHMDKLLTLVEVMQTNSQLPCFKSNPNAVKAMRERFHLNMTEEQLNLLIENLVESSVHSITTRLYDGFQYLTNGIL